MKKTITAIVALVAALIGGLLVGGFAAAQGVASSSTGNHLSNGTYHFYLNANRKLCISDNGADNQMTVETGNCANIKVSWIKGFSGWRFFTVFGHCIYANTNDNKVKVSNERCIKSHNNDLWTAFQDHPYKFNNAGTDLDLKTEGLSSGDKVWVGRGGFSSWHLVKQ